MVIQPTTVIDSVLLLNFIHAMSSYKFNKIFKSNYSLSRKLQKVVLKSHPGNFRPCKPQNLALPEKYITNIKQIQCQQVFRLLFYINAFYSNTVLLLSFLSVELFLIVINTKT